MERNLLLTVEYDGTFFHGWQRQPGIRTAQGELERVLSILCAQDVTVDGTSRTDAGVHALSQKVTLKGDFAIPTANIKRAANNLLEGDLRIIKVEEMGEGFHARFNCKGKKYIYRIATEEQSVFERNYVWQINARPDVELMRKAASYIIGTHDFACFQAAGGEEKETTVRTVWSLDVSEKGNHIEISVTGDGFLYNMVRIITGTLLEAGLGTRAPESVAEAIEKGDRARAGLTAPPQGLYLAEVYY